MESIQLWSAPCGCSFHQAHKGDGSQPRFVTLKEAESIVDARRNHPDYVAITTTIPQPAPQACERHEQHQGFKRFDEVCKETKSHHHSEL